LCRPCHASNARVYRSKCPELYRERQRLYYDKVWKHRRLELAYGITRAQWELLWGVQKGICPICLRKMLRHGNKGLSACVDHDHAIGYVRGLLCHNCNTGIGAFREDVFALERAVGYINEKRAESKKADGGT
jgi:hypothetical protein